MFTGRGKKCWLFLGWGGPVLQLSRGQALFPDAQGAATPGAWFPDPSSHSWSWQSLPTTCPQRLFFCAWCRVPVPSAQRPGAWENQEKLPLQYSSLGTKRGARVMLQEDTATVGRRTDCFSQTVSSPRSFNQISNCQSRRDLPEGETEAQAGEGA